MSGNKQNPLPKLLLLNVVLRVEDELWHWHVKRMNFDYVFLFIFLRGDKAQIYESWGVTCVVGFCYYWATCAAYPIRSRLAICQWWLHPPLTNTATINCAATIVAYKRQQVESKNEMSEREKCREWKRKGCCRCKGSKRDGSWVMRSSSMYLLYPFSNL